MKVKGHGSTTYHNDNTGIDVQVSVFAEKILGAPDVPAFVARLTEFMAETRGKWAYVSKTGGSISVTIHVEGRLEPYLRE